MGGAPSAHAYCSSPTGDGAGPSHFVRPLSVFVSLPRIDVIGGVEYDNCVCWAQSVLCFVGIDSFRSLVWDVPGGKDISEG